MKKFYFLYICFADEKFLSFMFQYTNSLLLFMSLLTEGYDPGTWFIFYYCIVFYSLHDVFYLYSPLGLPNQKAWGRKKKEFYDSNLKDADHFGV